MNRSMGVRANRLVIAVGSVAGAVIGLTFLMLALAGAWHRKVPSDERPLPRSTVGGERGEVRMLRWPRAESAVGAVRAVHESAVGSKLLARVLEVRVKAGQTVERGELLVQLDDADLRARVQQAEAAVAAAQANLDRATSDHTRARNLVDRKAISRADFDQTVAALKTAEADVQRARQSLEETKILLGYATVLSPLTGIVIDKRIEAGDTATPGQVLVTLYEPERMQLVATVRESLALRLKPGDQIPARLDALGHECLATVSEIVPRAEAESRSFTVKVTGPCPPGAYSGMFGRISIPLEDEQVLVVPQAAVLRVGQLELVDVETESGVRRRAIRTGREHDGEVEVLSGLRAGDRVVLHAYSEAKP